MDIYNRKNEMRRVIYSEMLKKGQQKPSMRLYDRVIIKERLENKSHDHVQKPRAFSKGRTASELTLTLVKKVLTESRFKLILGHSSQTLTTRVVRKLYPQDMKHIRNNLRCDNNARTSNASEKMRY